MDESDEYTAQTTLDFGAGDSDEQTTDHISVTVERLYSGRGHRRSNKKLSRRKHSTSVVSLPNLHHPRTLTSSPTQQAQPLRKKKTGSKNLRLSMDSNARNASVALHQSALAAGDKVVNGKPARKFILSKQAAHNWISSLRKNDM